MSEGSQTSNTPPRLLILLIALVYGSFLFLSLRNLSNSVKPDSQEYLKLADNLRHHHAFSMADAPPYSPEVFRLPVYPLFLAAAGATDASSVRTAVILQYLLCFLLVFFAWPFFYRFAGPTGALMGIVFLLLDLNALLHDGVIVTEALFTVASTAACCFSIRYFEKPSWKSALPSGVAFGITALIKPITLSIAMALIPCALLRKWQSGLLLLLFALALPLCWVARNRYAAGKPVYTVQGGLALFRNPAAAALAIDTGRTRAEAMQAMEASLRRDGSFDRLDPVSQGLIYRREAIETMKRHPVATLRYCAIGAVRILMGTEMEMLLDLVHPQRPVPLVQGSDTAMTGSGTLYLLRTYPLLIPIQFLYMLMLGAGYILFCGGIWKLARHGEWTMAAYLFLSVTLIVAISAHQGYYRYRIPLLPFLAFGIAVFFKQYERE